ncbi:MAG: putative transposase [Amycolatopsis sp.]|uniref:tyrosine-type recombinase/integrase n=1 Tax=Amycolatopsis sp. TaxID=37632 RepID=UPI00261F3F8B|nr:site-specific integrase [Amycolatopsis sp.]MCU1681913.1 putative transposase [Amycolatopsis sp.]
MIAEVLYGVHERTRNGSKTPFWTLRPYCDRLRQAQAATLEDLPAAGLAKAYRSLHHTFATALRRHGMTPETERHKDIWDMSAFGHLGTLRFTDISQPWLREAAQRWAFSDVSKRRGRNLSSTTQTHIAAMVALSESQRLQRDDHGSIPGELTREDITAFCNRLAYLENQDTISAGQRRQRCMSARQILVRIRSLGITRPGEFLHGLQEDFTLTVEDIPDPPEDTEAGRDLPVEVMRHLCANLPALEVLAGRDIRIATELVIDTGRRPDEVCQLQLECLERDRDGKPVLIYDNHKVHRKGRRLPIGAATAGLIVHQQERVRARSPASRPVDLKLFPAPAMNPAGHRAIAEGWVSKRHREWSDQIPEVLVPVVVDEEGQQRTKTLPFDKARIFPYAYRHCYAQRHADAGVDVDVLRDLMDHRQLLTTQRYCRVGEERRRAAVERVTTMHFDRHGNRIWRQAKAMLDSERARQAVGEVAVPYGRCSEPSNVAAGGQDCPIRFRCIGCGHFDTDVSYLPDLEHYLADLLRNRERSLAALDADHWAKSEAAPSDDEITRIRHLIVRMKSSLDDLSEHERAEIEDAAAIVRRGRARIVGLGLPTVRASLPDMRPERPA